MSVLNVRHGYSKASDGTGYNVARMIDDAKKFVAVDPDNRQYVLHHHAPEETCSHPFSSSVDHQIIT